GGHAPPERVPALARPRNVLLARAIAGSGNRHQKGEATGDPPQRRREELPSARTSTRPPTRRYCSEQPPGSRVPSGASQPASVRLISSCSADGPFLGVADDAISCPFLQN